MSITDNSNIYLAIIGDIKKSKQIADRYKVQNELANVLDDINIKYNTSIASKFMITLGDEFQGLLIDGKNTLSIITQIEDSLFPVEMRFGIGIGSISTKINYELPIGADGPAYYQARRMITAVRKLETKALSFDTNIMVCSEDVDLSWVENPIIDNGFLEKKADVDRIDELLNSALSLSYIIKRKWSPRQREIIKVYESESNSQVLAAVKLGIKQSSVNKSLAASAYYSYRYAYKTITNYLDSLCQDKSSSALIHDLQYKNNKGI